MRPIKLTISGFGSYVGVTELNLEELGTEGLYLVSGPTGSGKTTIFDAIIFALYGDSSSSGLEKREYYGFRSKYVEPTDMTFVELTFEHGGKVYTVNRNLDYERLRLKGKGTTTEKKNATLIMPDDSRVTSFDGVTEAIYKILNLDKNQFCQISMIAQGEFRKMLQASTPDRVKIFRKLFKTNIYNHLSKAMEADKSEADKESKRLEQRIQDEFKRVTCLDDEDIGEWREVLSGMASHERAGEILEKMLERQMEKGKVAADRRGKLESDLNAISLKLNEAKKQKKWKSQLDTAKADQEKAHEESLVLEGAFRKADSNRQEITELRAEALSKSDRLKDYDEAEKKAGWVKELNSKVQSLSTDNVQGKTELDCCSITLDKAEQEAEGLKNAGENLQEKQYQFGEEKKLHEALSKLSSDYSIWEKQIKQNRVLEAQAADAESEATAVEETLDAFRKESSELSEASVKAQKATFAISEKDARINKLVVYANKLVEWEKLKDETLGAQSDMEAAYNEYEKADREYQRKYKAFLMAQAGIMASKLKEETPCPVCGSTSHPNPAVLSQESVTEDMVNTAKNLVEDRNRILTDKKTAASSFLGRFVAERKNVIEQCRELFPEASESLLIACSVDNPAGNDDISLIINAIKDEHKSLTEEKKQLCREKKKAEEDDKRKRILDQELIPQAVENEKSAKETSKKKLLEKTQGIEKAKAQIADLKNQCETYVPDLDAVQAGFAKELSTKLSEVRKRMEELNKDILNEQKRVKRRNALEKEIPELKEKKKNAQDILSQLEVKLASEKSSFELARNDLAEFVKKLPWKEKWQAEKEIKDLEAKATRFEKQITEKLEAWDEKKKEINTRKGVITALEKQLEECTPIDEEAESQRFQSLTEEKELVAENQETLAGAIKGNKASLDHIRELAPGCKEAYARYQSLKELADTASGKTVGKTKVSLETYVQASYLENIVKRANIRLRDLSSGKYELKRFSTEDDVKFDNKKEHSLDLFVIDHHNDTVRSVSTLSGGEAFLASLALAMGLSDEVTASANNIRVDTLFVDEGFGSLDEETLRVAIDALSNLTKGGRLVGIITHVAELKGRITKQIEVSKDRDGRSSAKLVL